MSYYCDYCVELILDVGGCCLFVLLDLQNNLCKNVRVLSSDNLKYMNQTFGAIFQLKFNQSLACMNELQHILCSPNVNWHFTKIDRICINHHAMTNYACEWRKCIFSRIIIHNFKRLKSLFWLRNGIPRVYYVLLDYIYFLLKVFSSWKKNLLIYSN